MEETKTVKFDVKIVIPAELTVGLTIAENEDGSLYVPIEVNFDGDKIRGEIVNEQEES